MTDVQMKNRLPIVGIHVTEEEILKIARKKAGDLLGFDWRYGEGAERLTVHPPDCFDSGEGGIYIMFYIADEKEEDEDDDGTAPTGDDREAC